MILFIAATFICIFFILVDFVPIYRNRQWKLLWVYSVMLVLAYVLLMLIALEIRIPSPAGPIKKMVSAIWGL